MVDAANKDSPGTFPNPCNLAECIEIKELAWWQGKVKRLYMHPQVQYENLTKFYADYIDGPYGYDTETQTHVVMEKDRAAFQACFLGVLKLAQRGHLTGRRVHVGGMQLRLCLQCTSLRLVLGRKRHVWLSAPGHVGSFSVLLGAALPWVLVTMA